MTARRVYFASAVVLLALLLQLTLLARLGLPGATPDLLLVVVVALAIAYGPLEGMLIGFFAGLTADLIPPADHALGRFAFVICLVGYLAGRVRGEAARSALGSVLFVAMAAVGAAVIGGGLAEAMGEADGLRRSVLQLLPTAVLYDVVLAPFVVPTVIRLANRIEPAAGTYAI